MQFTRGNLELRNHIKNGKRVFLFIQAEKAYVLFEAELSLLEFDYEMAPDRVGNDRIVIKFFFKKASAKVEYELNDSAHRILMNEMPATQTHALILQTERQGLVTSRVGQGAYRKSILYRWEFKCAVTQYEKNEILIASHIVPWKNATDEERLDVNNGILLSPTYDALFDRRLISFKNTGKIILSETLEKTNFHRLGVTGKEIIKDLSGANKYYLERHRKTVFG